MAKTAAATPREATQKQPAETHAHEGAGLHLHTRTVHPSLTIPYITREDVTSTARAAGSRVPGVRSGKDLAFYGGLAAMAALGALEWPVAVAVGGATWLVRSKALERGAETVAEHDGEGRAQARRTA
jgi:hypothetical protein